MSALLEGLAAYAWRILRTRLTEETSSALLVMKLRNKFDSLFRYNEHGAPRVWRNVEEVDELFGKAKGTADALLKVFRRVPFDASAVLNSGAGAGAGSDQKSEEDSFALITDEQARLVSERFHKDIEHVCMDAKRSVLAPRTQIPPLFWVLLLVLGWNEIWAVLSNPLYLVLAVFLLIGVYFVYALNMGDPLMRVTQAALAQGVAWTQAKLAAQLKEKAH